MVLQKFDIVLPNGARFDAELHTTGRRSGRRIIVRQADAVVFDTDDSYDLANATNSLDQWVASQLSHS